MNLYTNITDNELLFNSYFNKFSIIPLKKNSKQPAVRWKDYQNRKLTLDEAQQLVWDNIAIVTGTISGLIVVDADTPETIEFLETFEEFKNTARVETKRGRHYYFIVEDIPEGFGTHKIHKGNIRIDVKANGGYVVAPPSVVDGYVYRWLDSIDKAIKFKFSEMEELLNRVMKDIHIETKETNNERKELRNSVSVDSEKLKKLVLRHYEEGKRQDIVLYLSGWLKKEGVAQEEVEKLVVDICFDARDMDVKQRLSAVENTYKTNANVKGLSGLIECGFTEAELSETVKESKKSDKDTYIEIDGIVYTKKNNSIKMVGPAIKVSSVVIDGNHKAYEITYRGESEIIKDITDLATIQKFTGIAIVREKDFLEYMNFQAIKCSNKKYIRRATGWQDSIFYHPGIQTGDIWDYWGFFGRIKSFEHEKDKQHELIRDSMRMGGKLSFVYAFCMASVLNELLGTNPSVLFITGAARVGKTTLAQLGINLFLPSERVFTTTYSTYTGFELTMKQLRGLPILFDECILKDTELERIVFMVASKVGKIRGTKSLSVTTPAINSNVILTSEILEQDQFKRTGSHRRLVAITIEDFKKDCYPKLEINEIQEWREYYGAGVDVIRFLMANLEGLKRHIDTVDRDIKKGGLESLYHVAKPILIAIKTFEDFYGESFSKAYEDAVGIITEQKREFDAKVDILTKFKEDFTQYLARRSFQIIDIYDSSRRPSYDVIGQKEEENFYILTSAFRDFCIEHGFELKVLLKELVDNNILKRHESNRVRKIKKINGITASVYHIVLDQDTLRSYNNQKSNG